MSLKTEEEDFNEKVISKQLRVNKKYVYCIFIHFQNDFNKEVNKFFTGNK